MMDILQKLLILCPMLFIAGIVDGISGGGGLIALPSYLLAGLPVSAAYGCNKLQSFFGTSASLAKYAKSRMIDWKTALPAAFAAMAGSWAATQCMLMLPDGVKKMIVTGATLFVVGIMILSSRMKVEAYTRRSVDFSWKSCIICLCTGLVLGLYDGFFGPGGGTVALILFALLMKYDLRVGCGNGKLIVVVSNLISMVTYIIHGDIVYAIAVPCAVVNIGGSYLGATLATKRGAKFVKYISWAVVALLLVKTVSDMI